jgi:outer membrane protein assembly factor BamB
MLLPRFPRLLSALITLALVAIVAVGDGAPPNRGRRKKPRRPVNHVEPWDLASEPRPFDEVCFQDRSGVGGLSEQEARRLLEQVGNQPFTLTPQVSDASRTIRFHGLAKLRDWAPDAVLRCSCGWGKCSICFWNGQQGVVLRYYIEHNGQWAAYRITTPPSENPPAGQPGTPLITTDDARACRFMDDTFEVRCQDGDVVLTKGDVRLLTAPLGGQAVAVYLEAKHDGIMLRDLAVCRSGPAPEDPIRPHLLLQGNDPPASLAWKDNTTASPPATPALDAHFNRLPDGRVELSAGKTTTAVWATVPLPRDRLQEIIVEVENASPGTGIFLADDGGKPVHGLEFFRDHNTKSLALEQNPPGWAHAGAHLMAENVIAPYTSERQWLRIVAAAGMVKYWVSGDGIHWGRILWPVKPGNLARNLGLFVQPYRQGHPGIDPDRHIQLRTLQIRQLDGITALAPAELVEQAAAKLKPPGQNNPITDFWAWRSRVHETCPPKTEEPLWRLACAIETLSTTTNSEFARMVLVEQFLDDGLVQARSLEARIRMLQDSALLVDGTSNEADTRYAEHWEQVGRSLLADGSAADFDLLRRSFMAASISTMDQRIEPLSWKLAMDRLRVLMGRHDWIELQQWCNRLNVWHQGFEPRSGWPGDQEPLRRLLEWAEAELGAARAAPDGRSVAADEMRWRPPVSVAINREAYNTISELQSAADERLLRDAAAVLAASPVVRGDGLVPDAADAQLFASYAASVRLLMQRYPQLRQEIQARFGQVDQLRVREVMNQGDAPAIEAICVQYFGTPAAAAASRWIGDRLVSAGQFAQALAYYREALPATPPELRGELDARVRLASAMLGRKVGEPVRSPVALGAAQFAPDQFEQWIREAIAHSGGESADGGPVEGTLASPVKIEPQRRGRLEGDLGNDANQIPWPSHESDWPARQLAMLRLGDTILAANRFQVAALDAGNVRWKTGLGGNQGSTHGWALLPMRPAVAAGRVYARMLTRSGHPELVCIELAGGRKVWEREEPHDFISDPLVLGDRLFALAVEPSNGQMEAPLLLVELDRQRGDVIASRLLFDLRAEWAAEQLCQAATVGDRLVGTLGGVTFCLDAQQQLAWLRSAPAIPPALGVAAGEQYPQPPLAVGNRLYVAQPGVPNVECIELDTGRLVWRRGMVGLRRILDATADRLFLETTAGLEAFQAETGKPLWRREFRSLLNGFARPGPGLLLCADREMLDGGQTCPALLWLDAATGETKSRQVLSNLRSRQALLGPIVPAAGRFWTFTDVLGGNGEVQPQREIVELQVR